MLYPQTPPAMLAQRRYRVARGDGNGEKQAGYAPLQGIRKHIDNGTSDPGLVNHK
jgi:hypothetical protein